MSKENENKILEPSSSKKQVVLDVNAIKILNNTKERMKAEGMTGNSYSDAIRWLNNKLKEVQNDS